MTLLALRDIVVKYDHGSGAVTVLDRISLDIADGELVVALGASGCGKTTLLNLMAGFLMPDHGQVTFGGQPVAGPGAERGVVFQHAALLPWLNVVDNAAFGLRLRGIDRRERRQRAGDMLRLVGLEGVEGRRTWELSGGMRQRVGVARALTADPQVLLMDEPLGALDALTREQMQELILDVWSRTRKSIFFITHGIEEAIFLATRLLVMSPRPGRVIASFDLDFSRRFAAGATSASIRRDPAFSDIRERVKALILGQRELVGDAA